MLQKQLSREQVTHLGEQLLKFMEDHIIEAGYQYFSKGMVFNIHVINDGSLITSDVQGTRTYHVEIDLETFVNSNCACSYSRFCKHIAATFFQIYSVFDNPKNYLQLVQQPRKIEFSPAMLYPIPLRPVSVNRPDEQLPDANPVPLTEVSDVEAWWGYFESMNIGLPGHDEAAQVPVTIRNSYQRLIALACDWKKERSQLFAVHAVLFYLQRFEAYVAEFSTQTTCFWFRGLSQTVELLMEQLEGTLFQLNKNVLREQYGELLEQTLSLVKQLKSRPAHTVEWTKIYRILWWYLLVEFSWIQAEVEELQQRTDDEEVSRAEIRRTNLLLAHFAVMNGEDEVALQIWHENDKLPLSFYLFYLKAFSARSEWQRLLTWYDWLEQLMADTQGEELRLVTAIWRLAFEQTDRSDEWGLILRRLLPGSYYEYVSYLFEKERYREWLDVQMSYGVSYSHINGVYLKNVEEVEPTLVFSFYIREVNRLIEERTRPSYKEAIKLLKRLHTLYLQANQNERWEPLLQHLSTTYSRLRAFQEELRRGNLIS
ncbi:SWIM zinc finger family protein [Brevibacillus ginsengisoli]|uniref:SWIM zinc finger family protein n=1 Tax=Brevibacillus ginsengisoli TaxID=363854 RepID=UPI003CE9558D